MKRADESYLRVDDNIELEVDYNPQKLKPDFKPVFLEKDLILGYVPTMRIFKPEVYPNLNKGEKWKVLIKKINNPCGRTRDRRWKIVIEIEVVERIEDIKWIIWSDEGIALKQHISGNYEISCQERKLLIKEVAYKKNGTIILIDEYYVDKEGMIGSYKKETLTPGKYIQHLQKKSGMSNLIRQPKKFISQLPEYKEEN